MTTAKTTPVRARKATTPRKTAAKPPVVAQPMPEAPKAVSEASEAILIHILGYGLTFFGYNWQPGQELEITKPSPEYDRTCDAAGVSWLSMTDQEQIDRWGEVKFRRGSSPIPNSVINYKTMSADGTDSYGRPKYSGYMSAPEREKAALAEIERGRNVPTF